MSKSPEHVTRRDFTGTALAFLGVVAAWATGLIDLSQKENHPKSETEQLLAELEQLGIRYQPEDPAFPQETKQILGDIIKATRFFPKEFWKAQQSAGSCLDIHSQHGDSLEYNGFSGRPAGSPFILLLTPPPTLPGLDVSPNPERIKTILCEMIELHHPHKPGMIYNEPDLIASVLTGTPSRSPENDSCPEFRIAAAKTMADLTGIDQEIYAYLITTAEKQDRGRYFPLTVPRALGWPSL